MKSMKTRSFLSLKRKIIGSFIILILLSSAVIGISSYYSAKNSIDEVLGNTALSIDQSISGTIDAGQFKNLKTPDDMNSSYYKELQKHLNDTMKSTGLKYIYTIRKDDNGKYIYVVDGTSMNDENFSSLGDEEKDISTAMNKTFGGISSYEFSSDKWGHFISAYVPIKDKDGSIVGILGADFNADEMVKNLDKFKMKTLVIILGIIFVGILISGILSEILVRSISKLTRRTELIKDGDLTVEIEDAGNDEVGVLSRSFKDMLNNLLIVITEIKNNTAAVTSETDDMYKRFAETTTATEAIAKIIASIASDSTEQTNSVEGVSMLMENVFKEVKKSADNAASVSNSSNQAVEKSVQAIDIFKISLDKVSAANKSIEHTASVVEDLRSKSKEITAFSELISNITSQTNLLSLNASIEASRAGEHGKGFAVVADEVKSLAEQSSEASIKIKDIANSMQTEIDKIISFMQDGVVLGKEGINAVESVDTYLEELQASNSSAYLKVQEIIESIYQIENACKYSLEKVQKLADISRNFNAASQEAAASSEEQSAIMEQLNENLGNIRNMTLRLNDVVNKFKVN